MALNVRGYAYNGEAVYPGPTLSVRPGQMLKVGPVFENRRGVSWADRPLVTFAQITLENDLPAESLADAARVMNEWRNPMTTNIHTHGLYVNPNEDSIFIDVQPGETHTYELEIPEDHHPGLHWYHAHHHGSSTLQIMGGLFGALVIDDGEHESGGALAEFEEELLVLSRIKMEAEEMDGGVTQSCGNHLPFFNPFKVYSLPELEEETTSEFDLDVEFHTSKTDQFLLVNGQYMPTMSMTAGVGKHLRLVYAAGGGRPSLSVRSEEDGRGPRECELTMLAADGIYFDEPRSIGDADFQLMPGSRADVILTCDRAGTYYLASSEQGTRGLFMQIDVSGSGSGSDASAVALAGIPRPDYLDDLTQASVDKHFEIHFSQGGRDSSLGCYFWMGMGSDCQPIEDGDNPSSTHPTCPFAPFGGHRGLDSSDHLFTATVGDVVEFAVYGLGNDPHPLHIHVSPFQVVSYDVPAGEEDRFDDWMVVGGWYDVVPALPGKLTIRFRAAPLPGEIVVHCHHLMHEDWGLMETFLVAPVGGFTAAEIASGVVDSSRFDGGGSGSASGSDGADGSDGSDEAADGASILSAPLVTAILCAVLFFA